MTISSSKRVAIGKLLKKSRSGSTSVFHIIPQKGRWSIKAEGSEKAHKILDTKKEAIDYARSAITGRFTRNLIVHNKDGKIASTITIETVTNGRKTKDSATGTSRVKK